MFLTFKESGISDLFTVSFETKRRLRVSDPFSLQHPSRRTICASWQMRCFLLKVTFEAHWKHAQRGKLVMKSFQAEWYEWKYMLVIVWIIKGSSSLRLPRVDGVSVLLWGSRVNLNYRTQAYVIYAIYLFINFVVFVSMFLHIHLIKKIITKCTF